MTEYHNADNIQIRGFFETTNGSTKVTATRENFEPDVVKLLDWIWASQTGNAVLRNIGAWPGNVYIIPRPGTPGEPFNSEAMLDALAARIAFEPLASSPQANSLNACEILLHELVHSLRGLTGKAKKEATGDSYQDIEEYYAIVVANVYRSELKRTGLRGGHGSESLPPKQRDSAAVFLNADANRKRLERLQKENGDFFRDVGNVIECQMEPIQAHDRPREKAIAATLRSRLSRARAAR